MNYLVDGVPVSIEATRGLRYHSPRMVDEDTVDFVYSPEEERNDIESQAKQYLLITDFKQNNGVLTGEQNRLRAKARNILDGTFVEPPSNLFDK